MAAGRTCRLGLEREREREREREIDLANSQLPTANCQLADSEGVFDYWQTLIICSRAVFDSATFCATRLCFYCSCCCWF